MSAAAVAAMLGCGSGPGAETEPGGEVPSREAAPESRFEVSVDTQRVANPDAEVAPSENPDN